MATIKEIAAKIGLSPSTVSIVLRGNAAARNIPEATQNRVRKAATEMRYQPSIAARSLRTGTTQEDFQVAVFWAQDFRAPMMVRFLRGLRQAMADCGRSIRLVVMPYMNDRLYEEKALLSLTDCHAAIICNASEKDLLFLNEKELLIPVVLYNRQSEKYCTVNVSDTRMGQLAARAFAQQGCKRVSALTSSAAFPGMDVRVDSFQQEASRLGLTIQPLRYCENSMEGGYRTVSAAGTEEAVDGLFCGSDAMALGALRAFYQRRLRVPEDCSVIAVGNGDREQEEYSIPSLSVVHLPMEAMAAECLLMLIDLVEGRVEPPFSKELPLEYISRESCGPLAAESGI